MKYSLILAAVSAIKINPDGLNQMKLAQFIQIDLESDPICSSAGCEQFKHPEKEEEPPKDYFVPNFGDDVDVIGTRVNEQVASKLVGHNWAFKTEDSYEKYRNKAKDTEYNYYPKLDEDMATSVQSMQFAEGLMHPMDSVANGSSLLQLESDPICASSGCNQYKHAEPEKGHPIDYKVPDFGQDADIATSLANEALASKMINHKWGMGTKKHFEEYRNKAKDTNYNFEPKLDRDVVNTLKHASDAEDTTGQTWEIKMKK